MRILTVLANSALTVLLLVGVISAVTGLPDAIYRWASEPEDAVGLAGLIILGAMGSATAGANAYTVSMQKHRSRRAKLALHILNISFLAIVGVLVLTGAASGPNSSVEKLLLFPPLIIVGLGYWYAFHVPTADA